MLSKFISWNWNYREAGPSKNIPDALVSSFYRIYGIRCIGIVVEGLTNPRKGIRPLLQSRASTLGRD